MHNRHLNELEPFKPSSTRRPKTSLCTSGGRCTLPARSAGAVEVWETPENSAIYRRAYRARLDTTVRTPIDADGRREIRLSGGQRDSPVSDGMGNHMKCDNCNKTATVHLTEIKDGKKIEKHLCEQCAAQNEGLPGQEPHADQRAADQLRDGPLGPAEGAAGRRASSAASPGPSSARAGCSAARNDYTLFEKDLTPLLQRAHEGATHHVGKVPRAAAARACR